MKSLGLHDRHSVLPTHCKHFTDRSQTRLESKSVHRTGRPLKDWFYNRRRTPFLVLAVLWILPASRALSDPFPIPPDGPEQMAVLYTHGFNDDGGSWGMGDLSSEAGTIPSLSIFQSRYQNNTNTNIRLFAAQGM